MLFCLFRVAIFLSETLMQSFTVYVMIGVSTDIFLFFYLFLSVYFFLLFSILFRFYLCTVCTIFIIIIIGPSSWNPLSKDMFTVGLR